MKILIGMAWPFANGSLHVGHLAGLMPADVIARYYRLKGDEVYFVSGSDCYGSPIAIRAKQEGKTPLEISDHYHSEFCECFDKLGFSHDNYGKTTSGEHMDFVREFHKVMYGREYIYEKEAPQAYCENCGTSLADRFVVGKCPDCGERARGDQCDACGTVLDPENLIDPQCSICGTTPVFRPTNHLYIAISKFEKELAAYIEARPHWRVNAVSFSRRYIDEGLRDRAVTRDLDWGIDVPKDGFEDKKIYVWAENVLGYLSMSKAVADRRGADYGGLWGDDSRHYYVHGKDNIPFHTIILPSLMLAHGGKWKMPDDIISSEYLTLEGRKISTSLNWAIWVKDIVDRYHPDSIRYFLISSGPERRDTDFTWKEFINSHNGELLGAWGNFVNRTLAFVYKYFDAAIPGGELNPEIVRLAAELYPRAGKLIENGDLKEAVDSVFEFVRYGNKYFDTEQPWKTRTSDITKCAETIYNCVYMIANLAIMLEPFLPFSSAKVKKWLAIGGSSGVDKNSDSNDGVGSNGGMWSETRVPAGLKIPEPEILYERLDKKVADEELERLRQSLKPTD
jgi:methionyl-tRNA synthetase